MLATWAKWLPYWVVMRITKHIHSADGSAKFTVSKEHDYDVEYYRMGEGEFVVYSHEIQDEFHARQKEKRDKKLDKKMKKINKMMRGDWGLKNRLKEQMED